MKYLILALLSACSNKAPVVPETAPVVIKPSTPVSPIPAVAPTPATPPESKAPTTATPPSSVAPTFYKP